MEYVITYLIVGIAFLFLIISYKFSKPVLGIFAGTLFVILAFNAWHDNIMSPSGSKIVSQVLNENITYYNETNMYSSIEDESFVDNKWWAIIFSIIGIWIILESFARIWNWRTAEFVEEKDRLKNDR